MIFRNKVLCRVKENFFRDMYMDIPIINMNNG